MYICYILYIQYYIFNMGIVGRTSFPHIFLELPNQTISPEFLGEGFTLLPPRGSPEVYEGLRRSNSQSIAYASRC